MKVQVTLRCLCGAGQHVVRCLVTGVRSRGPDLGVTGTEVFVLSPLPGFADSSQISSLTPVLTVVSGLCPACPSAVSRLTRWPLYFAAVNLTMNIGETPPQLETKGCPSD